MASGLQLHSASGCLKASGALLQSAQPRPSNSCSQGFRPLALHRKFKPALLTNPLLQTNGSGRIKASHLPSTRLLSSRPVHKPSFLVHRNGFLGVGVLNSAAKGRPTRQGENLCPKAIGADAEGESVAGPSGRGDSPWDEEANNRGGSTAAVGGPVTAVLSALESAIRFVIVKLVLVLHRVLLLAAGVLRTVWRILPTRAVGSAVEPVVYGDGVPRFHTPWFLKPIEFAVRIVLFFVPKFVKRRVGPVVSGVVGTAAERSLSLVRKGAKQGLGGVREWGGETYEMAREGAPEARKVGVQVAYRVLQFYAFTTLFRIVAGLRHLSLYDLAWVPKSIVTLWRGSWAVIDYVLLDMDWVQPLQRLIVEVIWPFWRDYWLLAALCAVIYERMFPTLQTEYDIYLEEIYDG